MPLNFSENRQNIEESRREALRQDIEKLKKILEVKEKELKTPLETTSLKEEILRVREKIKSRSIEYEKIREKKEEKEEKEISRQDYEEIFVKRKFPATQQQIKNITKQVDDTNIRHQITILVNLAVKKSVYYAVKVARKIGNAYLLDRFHDAIVNELYEDLVKKKKIKPIK
jgi:hypothetical protein